MNVTKNKIKYLLTLEWHIGASAELLQALQDKMEIGLNLQTNFYSIILLNNH